MESNNSPDTVAHIFSSETDQEKHIKSEMLKCLARHSLNAIQNTAEHINSSFCSPAWDGILCWNETEADSYAVQPCPHYIAGFDRQDVATRQCMENGQWYVKEDLNLTWTNYTQCYTGPYATVVMNISLEGDTNFFEVYMPILKMMSRIGYFVSLSTLLVAFCIMFFIRKLHCARNKLHMHLFASFIFRASMVFLKDLLFIRGVGFSADLMEKDGQSYFVDQIETNNWSCKLFTSLWQYFIAANYSWILMEGLYLHNLILLALFSDSNNSILYYTILGWGLPLLVVCPWVIARINLDDNFCWTTHHNNTSIFLIIRIPTMISILINLVLFINIARVLLSKLSSPVSEEARCYRRWARSTLVLVPLFGVHYAVFLGMSYSINKNQIIELIWLFCDQLFASFQGFFVAVLYCFLNGEVRTEVRPHINNILSKCFSSSCCQFFFNCKQFSRATRGRTSVCTTLSCSSLYNSTVQQKFQHKRGKWEATQHPNRTRHSVIHEQGHEHCQNCQTDNKYSSNLSVRWNNQNENIKNSSNRKPFEGNCICSSASIPVTEMTACLGGREATCDLEMITLAHN